MLFEGGRDFMNFLLTLGFRPEADVLAEAKAKALPRYMPLFEKVTLFFN